MNAKSEIPKLINLWLENTGMNLSELARKVETNQQNASRWATGESVTNDEKLFKTYDRTAK